MHASCNAAVITVIRDVGSAQDSLTFHSNYGFEMLILVSEEIMDGFVGTK